ncbi:MAG: cytochrome C oxidase subunit IV family protein [Kofleriaceae bacterium]
MAAHDAHDHHDDDHGHGIAHVASARTMLTTWGMLMVLTVITVLATKVDFGSKTNLALAMAVAAIKATLVVLFFMHLRYDKLFHSVLLVGAILAGALFVGFTLMDSNQYQHSIQWNARQPLAAPDGPAIKARTP